LLSLNKDFLSASVNNAASETVEGDVIVWFTCLPKVVAYHCVPSPGGLKDATALFVVLKAVEVDVLNDAIELSTVLKPVEVEVDNEATELLVVLKAVEVDVVNDATSGLTTLTHVPAPFTAFATVQF
jgi:hypothetical protein